MKHTNMNKKGDTRQKISGSIAILTDFILTQEQSRLIIQTLRGRPSTKVTIIRDTRDGSLQVWPGETTEGEPIVTFRPFKGNSKPGR
jgi:hypothetical protein